ncbi:putative 2OG-Fe(II) oxygenase [Novosphingobium sp. KACC 22771]|uniref:putative 2OG-Fe(II) oxygenase n=1 Tax=Novosphingobium sp. KACC 22771 TaxID=3025670 RepID=UPI00236522E1|nr:putative 2OG-Fe(II) oxygenase [Novosphingobium sp. KACC 22771]WDF74017.1 putative 2OG-Fe(II) oxygenase [Novosphingobium sp. KACC 22771]
MSSLAIQWRDRARALRSMQRMIEADEAIAQARALAPDDRLIAFLHAQSRYELGHPAADLFAQVCRLWPDNPDALRNQAMALAAEGNVSAAVDMLYAALRQNPQWLDGHRVLASLRWVAGDAQGFDASYVEAARAHPRAQGLWLGWFSAVAQHRDWPRARAILDEAEHHLGQTKPLTEARLFIANESGDEAETARLLAATSAWDDPFIQIARIRAALRAGDPARALAIALPLAQAAPGSPLAGQAWPYVSTCWRLLDDARGRWLDGDFVRSMDVGLSEAELDELGDCLRALHTAQLPYPEQSVRGGTQTDRSVLLRHEPILQRARAALMGAVADYVAALPAPDPAHPLLSRARSEQSISGSWSVRLTGGGYNIPHSHPMGWISSAFYVSLPGDAAPAPAGHFHYGAPPLELGLDLAPCATIAPRRGDVVLFPSTLWHGTMPTASGERLNIAFDVVPAQH